MKLIIVGVFPPPINGLTNVTQAVYDRLISEGWFVDKFNTSLQRYSRTLLDRFSRFWVFFGVWIRIIKKISYGDLVYLPLSGGLGQVFDIVTVLLVRAKGGKLVFHHHSMAYLSKTKLLTASLFRIAGKKAVHITLCDTMMNNLHRFYGNKQGLSVSNYCFLKPVKNIKFRSTLKTVGYLSNITQEKGGWIIIQLAAEIHKKHLPIRFKVAGPCEEPLLHKALLAAHTQGILEWSGVLEDNQKKANFWDSIDLFVFPTQYVNEAEPLVIWEALIAGVPVIAYDRGCIPTQLKGVGQTIYSEDDFVKSAIKIIELYYSQPEIYQKHEQKIQEAMELAYQAMDQQWKEFIHVFHSIK
jgi:glycosyltransferase involved in cell wall biosynthesis